MGDVADTLVAKKRIQNDVDALEKLSEISQIKFRKDNGKELHIGWNQAHKPITYEDKLKS